MPSSGGAWVYQRQYTGQVTTPAFPCHHSPMTKTSPDAAPNPQLEALKQVTMEIEKGTARLGWDKPASLYALVSTRDLLDTPDLPADVEQQLRDSWDGSENHLSAILQESFTTDNVEAELAQISWPPAVLGSAVSVELVTLPPDAEENLPADPEAAAEYAANHPARTDVRFTAAALRSSESWCAVRAKTHDSDDQVATGESLVPRLVDSLLSSFLD